MLEWLPLVVVGGCTVTLWSSVTTPALSMWLLTVLGQVIFMRWRARRRPEGVKHPDLGADALNAHNAHNAFNPLKALNPLAPLNADERRDLHAQICALQAQIEQTKSEARARCRARSALLAEAAHDLKQPLYAISLLADTLALQLQQPEQRSIVLRQQQAIGVLRAQFDSLIDLVRVEAESLPVKTAPVALPRGLAPLLTQFRVLAESKALRWHARIAPVTVLTDQALLQRLISNLLFNAIRHTDQGEVSIEAEVCAERVAFVVRDTGCGIPAKYRERVFEPFVRLDPTHCGDDGGTGLGLAIARCIGERLDARLTLDPTAATKGSCFRFSLPLLAASASDQPEVVRPQNGLGAIVRADNPV
ncbi:MAG: sensor histidine kinase [Rhodocyclaceae bacterium]